MMYKKRIISLIISLTIIFSAVPVLNASAVQDYTNAYGLLKALKVFKGESDVNRAVARKELAVYVQKISGASGSVQNFYDVDPGMKEANAIYAVAQNGYMTGSDGYFYPDRALTKEEALTVLLRLAGYTDAANSKGGYYSGYHKWAVSTKLLSNINSNTAQLTHGELAQLLYNFMGVSMFVVDSITTDGNSTMLIDNSHTVLNEFFNVNKWKGAVVATHNASIWKRELCSEDYVIISNGTEDFYYKNDGSEYDTKLGINATFYTVNGEEDIVYAEFDTDHCEEVSFTGDDIMDINRALTHISYTDSKNKLRKLNTREASFIYNGRLHNGISTDEIKTDFSVIECRDTNSDSRIDIVYVWNYDVVMVENISFENYTITDKLTGKIIDFNPDECETYVSLNGGEYDLSDISKDYTLLIAEAYHTQQKDRKLTIKAFPDVVEGKVTAMNNGESIDINGETFKVRDSFYEKYSPELNENYLVGIDFNSNALCMIKCDFWPQKYGFAMNVATEGALSQTIKIRIFTEDNQFRIFEFAKKFSLNGRSRKAKYSELLSSPLFDGEFVPQLVSYRLNSNGEITHINVAEKNEKEPTQAGSETLTLNKKYTEDDDIAESYYNVYNDVALFGGDYVGMNGITKNFFIFTDGGEFVEERFKTGTALDMTVSEGVFNIELYDASYERVAGAAVYYATMSNFSAGDSDVYSFVVSDIRHKFNDDGEDLIQLTGLWQGKTMTLTENDIIDFSGIRPGDVLVTWNAQDELKSYKVMFSLDENTLDDEDIRFDCLSDEFRVINKKHILQCRLSGFYREIVSASPASPELYLTKTKGNDVEARVLKPITVASYTNYYIYDTITGELKTGTKSDLNTSCKNVYFVNTYGVPRDVIIYK